MRKVIFHKVDSDTWTSRPFQGWEYRIIKRWLKGYSLSLNGEHLGSEARLNLLKQQAQEHFKMSEDA